MERLSKDILSRLKQSDPDHYVITLFAPAEKRQDLLTLYAFNMELSRIPFTVTEPLLGEIKYQWWRDTIQNTKDGQRSGNPLADRLCTLIHERNLPMVRLMEMIDARSFDLSGEPFEDYIDLKIYLKKTSISLFKLSLFILSDEIDKTVDKAAEEAGMSYGLARILNKLPENLSNGIIHIPALFFSDRTGFKETLFKGEMTSEYDEFQNAVSEISTLGLGHLDAFKVLEKQISTRFSPAFLPMSLVGTYMGISNSSKYNQLRELVAISPLFRLWKYWRAAAFGAY